MRTIGAGKASLETPPASLVKQFCNDELMEGQKEGNNKKGSSHMDAFNRLLEMKIKMEELGMMKEMSSSSSRSAPLQPQFIPYPHNPVMLQTDNVQRQSPRPPTHTPSRAQQPINDLTSLRLSSPVRPEDEEDEMMAQFWAWKLGKTKKESHRSKIEQAKEIIDDEMWPSRHLQQMSDPSSEFYKAASAKGIADGILCDLRRDLHEYKKNWRAGSALGSLGRR